VCVYARARTPRVPPPRALLLCVRTRLRPGVSDRRHGDAPASGSSVAVPSASCPSSSRSSAPASAAAVRSFRLSGIPGLRSSCASTCARQAEPTSCTGRARAGRAGGAAAPFRVPFAASPLRSRRARPGPPRRSAAAARHGGRAGRAGPRAGSRRSGTRSVHARRGLSRTGPAPPAAVGAGRAHGVRRGTRHRACCTLRTAPPRASTCRVVDNLRPWRRHAPPCPTRTAPGGTGTARQDTNCIPVRGPHCTRADTSQAAAALRRGDHGEEQTVCLQARPQRGRELRRAGGRPADCECRAATPPCCHPAVLPAAGCPPWTRGRAACARA